MERTTTANDEAQITTERDSYANGHRVTNDGGSSTTVARRLAAKMPRDAPIRRINQRFRLDHAHAATVWIDADNDTTGSVEAPDGWAVDSVFTSSTGTVGVRMRHEPEGSN